MRKTKDKKPKKAKRLPIEKDGKFYTVRGVELSRNDHTMTEAQFWAFILSALRKATKFWKPKLRKLHEGRRPSQSDNKRLKWENSCELCLSWVPESQIEIDHINPCLGINGIDKVCGWIERAFVEIEGFQRLCKDCHQLKTNSEKLK